MTIQELEIYNDLIKALLNLEEEGYKNRERLLYFVVDNLMNSSELLKDLEVLERITVLVNSTDITARSLELMAISLEDDYEVENTLNLGRNYLNSLLIGNLYIEYDKYFDLLGNYRIYKLENYPLKYLVDNKLESLIVKKEIREIDKKLIKKFSLKL